MGEHKRIEGNVQEPGISDGLKHRYLLGGQVYLDTPTEINVF